MTSLFYKLDFTNWLSTNWFLTQILTFRCEESVILFRFRYFDPSLSLENRTKVFEAICVTHHRARVNKTPAMHRDNFRFQLKEEIEHLTPPRTQLTSDIMSKFQI